MQIIDNCINELSSKLALNESYPVYPFPINFATSGAYYVKFLEAEPIDKKLDEEHDDIFVKAIFEIWCVSNAWTRCFPMFETAYRYLHNYSGHYNFEKCYYYHDDSYSQLAMVMRISRIIEFQKQTSNSLELPSI